MKRFMFLVAVILGMMATQSFSQENTSWGSSIKWDKKSKSQLKKEVRKEMNSKLQEFANKWTSEFINQDREVSVDEIENDLLEIAENFHNLYASASSAYIIKNKAYFKKGRIKPFPFDPRKEVKKEFRLIGEYLYEQREGFRVYLSHGNRGIEDYLLQESY